MPKHKQRAHSICLNKYFAFHKFCQNKYSLWVFMSLAFVWRAKGERPLLAYTAIYYIKEGRCPRDIGRKIRFAGRSFVDFMKQESWNSEVKFIYATLRVPRDFPEATIKTNPKNCLKNTAEQITHQHVMSRVERLYLRCPGPVELPPSPL